jgi:hypothetical protein
VKSLYLRISATVVVVLALFAFASGFMVEQHLDRERQRSESAANERLEAWADLIQRSLPGVDAPAEQQAAALREWSQRLRFPSPSTTPTAGASAPPTRSRGAWKTADPPYAVKLDDGRTSGPSPGQLRQLANSCAAAVPRGGRRRRLGHRCPTDCPAAPAWRSSWWCCSSPSPPAPIR